jgi:DNA-directed RNA polymerase sigma subunit (sigma70/sigma32)
MSRDLVDLLSLGEVVEDKSRLKTSPSMEELLYRTIKEQQIDLTKEEQNTLCNELSHLLDLFQQYAFEVEGCRKLIFREWTNRKKKRSGVIPSVAKLSADYNSSLKGHNQQLAKTVDYYLNAASWYLSHGPEMGAVIYAMRKANLARPLYYSPRMFKILEEEAEAGNTFAPIALGLRKDIQHIREKLVRCVLKAIAEIASSKVEGIRIHKGFNSPSVTVLSFADVVQEGIILALYYTLTYCPSNDAKWSSYVYANVKAKLSDYIRENTRTVAIPRTVMDRLQPLIRAVGMIGDSDYRQLALLANKLNAEQKKGTVGRKLKREEIYTVREVESLLPVIQNTSEMSLDVSITDTEDGNREVTIGDLIGVTEEPIYDEVEGGVLENKIRTALQRYIRPEYWEVLEIRWGLDDGVARGLDETTAIYKKRFPDRRMNKGKVKEIEAKVFKDLRNRAPGILIQLWEASEDIIDRRSGHSTYSDV